MDSKVGQDSVGPIGNKQCRLREGAGTEGKTERYRWRRL